MGEFYFYGIYKKSTIEEKFDNYYFWRTHSGSEIDIIKESDGKIEAIECKWQKSDSKIPKLWTETYPESSFKLMHKENYLDFLL